MATMMSGYAMELPRGQGWRGWESKDDDWDTQVYAPTGQERLVGTRMIDGTAHRVFLCPDGQFRAQTVVATGGAK